MYTHYGILAAHSLRSESNCIDSVFKQLFHLCRTLILIMTSQRSHQCLFRKQCCCLNRCCHTDTDQKRRTCIQTIRSHDIHYKFRNSFVALSRHQHHGFPRKCASSACHVSINLAPITVWHNIPEYCRCSFANIFACIVLVKCFHAVMTKRCFHCRFYNSFF